MTGLVPEFLSAGKRHAERIALVDGSLRMSYAELVFSATNFSVALQRKGLKRGDRVALILENSWQYVVAFYGVLMAGGVVVPLNSAAKAPDFINWWRHCNPHFMVVDGANVEVAKAMGSGNEVPAALVCGGGSIVPGESFEKQLGAGVTTAPEMPLVDAEECACILYTSGTTGNPKGVMLSAANLGHNASAIVQYLKLTCDDSIVVVLPFYYSYGNSILHSHLRVGATMILQKRFLYPQVIMEMLVTERVTGFAGVPSTFLLLLDRVTLDKYDLSSLRYITQAGGPMGITLTRRLRAALPFPDLFVMYGQTEASARVTYLPPQQLEAKLGSVGIPIPEVSIEIRDDAGVILSSYIEGQVWIWGPSIMIGYWRDPAGTAAVLSNGWLNTGDMGYLDEDGYLFLAGRRSDIIKVGAHRVHPKDVEDVIAELSAVQEVAVLGVSDPLLGEAIRAVVVLVPGTEIDELSIKRHCLAVLPGYKVPKTVDFVSTLPRTASGKIHRAALSFVKSE